MKFIIDAQLPQKFAILLGEKGFDAIHTSELPNKNATTDSEINELSLKENRIVITKDSDFYNRYLVKSEPFKLIIVSTGNISNKDLLVLIEKNLENILDQISHNYIVEITNSSLITIL